MLLKMLAPLAPAQLDNIEITQGLQALGKFMDLPQSDIKLLADCEVNTFRSSGKGGQHVNKTDSAVRIKHLPTGIVVVSQKERSQYLNKLECLKKIRHRFKQLNYRPPKRIPTKIPSSIKAERRSSKEKHSQKKQHRQKNYLE